MNVSRAGIVVVVDDAGHLVETITDGDIRRAILNSISIDSPIADVIAAKLRRGAPQPLSADEDASSEELLQMMIGRRIYQVPIVDQSGVVVGLRLLNELVSVSSEADAVVMAGGFGKRLLPLTESTPKPMLPVGGRPVLEHIVERLRQAGIHRVSMATHFQADLISKHFKDGGLFGVSIDYVEEETPLGTAGALGLLEGRSNPILVVNGDVLTDVDFGKMLAFHVENNADITVGVGCYDIQVPYGVVDCEGITLVRLREKPRERFLVNAGIYVVQPDTIKLIAAGERIDMPEFLQRATQAKARVVTFPIVEYWLDIGGHDEYRRANDEYGKEQE
jgi:dTDP-glucose pyrophosphorylase